jgi:multidrug resistance efflux pump
VSVVSGLSFDGRIVPTKATQLRAPQNSFQIGGWRSSGSWIKLQELAPEGKEVKKGEVVGRFEFMGDRARPQIEERLNEAKAAKGESSLGLGQALDELRSQLERQRLEASSAALDTRKEGAISARELKIFQMTRRIAEFEAEGTERLLGVHQRRMGAEAAYHGAQVSRAQDEMRLLESLKDRFVVKAPHDGVVRHGYMRRQRRKVQKGDGMPSGMEFASLAMDRSVSVEFFVPERLARQVPVGSQVRLSSPALKEELVAVVEEVSSFPQELGFLREDEEMAGGREKVYVVRAPLREAPAELRAGLEVKVRREAVQPGKF